MLLIVTKTKWKPFRQRFPQSIHRKASHTKLIKIKSMQWRKICFGKWTHFMEISIHQKPFQFRLQRSSTTDPDMVRLSPKIQPATHFDLYQVEHVLLESLRHSLPMGNLQPSSLKMSHSAVELLVDMLDTTAHCSRQVIPVKRNESQK